MYVQPEWVQILTWNDYGESHYIGPLYDDEMDMVFTPGKGPFNYAENMPHDAWRQFLPFIIDMYKSNQSTVTQEGIVAWYRLSPSATCMDGNTVGNTHTQLQIEFPPGDVAQDKIFFSALLGSDQGVTVTVGGVNLNAAWSSTPSDGVGIYHGSVAYGSNTGTVVVTVGTMVFAGEAITTSCHRVPGQNGLTNWNAWVGSATGAVVNAAALPLEDQVCVRGTGASDFAGLCSFACNYGYCPLGACTCTAMGPPVTRPDPDTPGYGTVGFPAQGKSASYSGLCSFNCNYGYCPPGVCGTTQHSLVIPAVSEFLHNTCTSGTGPGNLGGLCSFACNFGFCPLHSVRLPTSHSTLGHRAIPPPTLFANG
jgi:hypothetical protein